MKHTINLKKEYLTNILTGKKKSLILFNDRDYQMGDTISITDFSGPTSVKHSFDITHISSEHGLEKLYICISLEEVT